MNTPQISSGGRAFGQRKIGVVVGKPGSKSVTIRVERLVGHPVYKRFVRRSKKFMAHDEREICGLGDTVEVVECRPLSARKRWRVERVVVRAEGRDLTPVPGTEA